MASKPMVPVEEYLRMRCEGPDPEYLDGELVERHLGTLPHSETQVNALAIFWELPKRTALHEFPELHLKTAPTRYRIADVAVFTAEPEEDIPSTPPLITIEIVSPDDSLREIRSKSREYAAWGVKYIWLMDPEFRKPSAFLDDAFHDVPKLEVPEFGLVITPEQVFG